jgi:hypothetical protein
MPRHTIPALLAGTVLALTGAGPAAAATTTTCRALAGKDLAHNGVVKVVRQSLGQGRSRYAGCARPDGKVHALSPVLGPEVGGFRETGSLQAVRGAFVIVKDSEIAGAGGSTRSRVVDARTGRSYTFFAASSSEETSSFTTLGSPKVEVQNLPGAVRAHLDARGRLAVAYTGTIVGDEGTRAVVIAAFSPSGRGTVLDQGAPADVVATSLALRGGVARWTSAGVVRSRRLP